MDFPMELGNAFARLNKVNAELMCRETDLRPNEVLTLFTIKKISSKTEVTPKMIGEKLLITKSAVSQLISSLEDNKYIKREISTQDKRYFSIVLTEKGDDLISFISKTMKKMGDGLFDYLGNEDSLLLLKLLNKTIEYYRLEKEKLND